ncbi:MAG TPA: DUF6206 family protein [Solirubrobacterales bacterium]
MATPEAESGTARRLDDDDLRALDAAVAEALGRGDASALPTLGFGEISLVLGWPREDPAFACKRLPPFRSRQRFDAYRATLDDYLAALRAAGIRVVDTEMRPVALDGEAVAGYVVQPILPAEELAPRVLARSDPRRGHPLLAAVAETAARTVSPTLGLDAQLANWIWDGEGLTYIDVSTPMIWSEEGECRLDIEPMSLAFPWILRGALMRFVAPGILDTYRDLRKVYFDICGNLLRDRLDAWLDPVLEQVNGHLGEPITADQVRRYYRRDKLLWASLLRARRLDRAWHLHVRRRPYPFLLPGTIDR